MNFDLDTTLDDAYLEVAGPIPDGGVDYSDMLDDNRIIDYDADDAIVAYEFLNVSKGVDLTGLPHRDELARVFAEHGIRVLAPGERSA